MRFARLHHLLFAGLLVGVAGPSPAALAQVAVRADSAPDLAAYARAFLAVSRIRDQAQAEFADPRNKKDEAQAEIRDKLRSKIEAALKEQKLTAAQYEHFTYQISVDPEQRKAFDALLAQLTKK